MKQCKHTKQDKTLVWLCWWKFCIAFCNLLTVIKAELTTEEDIESDKPYMFPDSDDNMTSFTGRRAQVMLSNELLKNVLSQLPPSKIVIQHTCIAFYFM